jgi:hypothetical protein
MKKAKTGKPPHGAPAMSVRLLDHTYKMLQQDMHRDGLPSLNAAIQRRLDRTLIDDHVRDVVNEAARRTSSETAQQFTSIIRDHIDNLMRDVAGEMQHLRLEREQDMQHLRAEREHDRRAIADLQQALIQQLAKQGA